MTHPHASPTNRRVRDKGIAVYRNILDPAAIEDAQMQLLEEFYGAVEPISFDDLSLPIRLSVVGRSESAQALMHAAGGGPVKSLVIMEQLEERLPPNVARQIGCYAQKFSVSLRKSARSQGVISLSLKNNSRLQKQRRSVTSLIDNITGVPYDWNSVYRPLVPVARLVDKSAAADIRDLRFAEPLDVILGKMKLNKRRLKSIPVPESA